MKNLFRIDYLKYVFLLLFIFITMTFLYYSRVDISLNDSDRSTVKSYLQHYNLPVLSHDNYQSQIDFIEYINNLVTNNVKHERLVRTNEDLDVSNILDSAQGLCFDRSFVVEKILKYYGFQTRHIFLLNNADKKYKYLPALLQKNVQSHALTEVLTKNGWLIVDSSYAWIGLDEDNKPISFKKLRGDFKIKWKNNIAKSSELYYSNGLKDISVFYGLYSRHGSFFKPFNLMPDIVYSEFLYNFYNGE